MLPVKEYSSMFSKNSEANTSDFRKNLEEMFLRYYKKGWLFQINMPLFTESKVDYLIEREIKVPDFISD